MTSEDLLGDDRADDSLVEGEEDNVEFHMTDDQQFEVLDSAEGKGQDNQREKVPPKEPVEQEGG